MAQDWGRFHTAVEHIYFHVGKQLSIISTRAVPQWVYASENRHLGEMNMYFQ